MKLLRKAGDQLQRFLAAYLRWAQAFRDWHQRPSTIELRSRKLLREWLSPEQLAQYDAHNYFEVIGCHTGQRYRINHGMGANVYELDDAGRPRVGWCFVPNDHLVAADVMLAQKIALETGECGALAVANSFTPTRFDFAAREQ
jgi:hypothetical protein